MKPRYFLFWVIFVMIAAGVDPAFSQQLKFSKIPHPNLPFGQLVTCITQDNDGYIWLSTASGVYKFDGYKFSAYQHDSTANSLAQSNTECIYADHSGIIWIGTQLKGLDRLDPQTGKFTHYKHDPANPLSLISDSIKAILEDHNGTLWIGTYNGLDRFDQEKGVFKHYQNNKNDSSTLSHNHVRVIYEDRQGILWIGTGSPYGDGTLPGEGGLNKYDNKTGTFIRYMHDPKNERSLINNWVRAICEDSHGNFWVGTAGDGLHKMDRVKGSFERYPYDPKHPDKLSRPALNPNPVWGNDNITFIREDATGCIWIGTWGNGISRYDPLTQKTTHYVSQDFEGGLVDKEIFWSYISRDGVLWLGCHNGNLYSVDPSRTIIPIFKTTTQFNSFYQYDPKILWIATDSGLVQYDQMKGVTRVFKHNLFDDSSLSNDSVLTVRSDKHGGLWIGMQGGGLDHYNEDSRSFTHYKHNPQNAKSLDNNNANTILVDHSLNVWVGTNNGLNSLNTATGDFTHYMNNPEDSNSLSFGHVYSLVEDQDSNYLWVGTFGGGINKLNRRTGKFEHYLTERQIFPPMIRDHEGIIWACITSEGLYRYNPEKNLFEQFNDPDNFIRIIPVDCGVIEDNQNNLWLHTESGIIRINKNRDQILSFDKNNDVKGESNWLPIACKDLSGRLYFRSVSNSYYSFSPDSLTKKLTTPELLISNIRIGYESVINGKDNFLNPPSSNLKEIDLNHNQNTFAFEFVAFNYANPEDTRIAYKLENYDRNWRKAGPDKSAQYFNIPPGQYIFLVKSATNMGVWNEKQVIVVINPPWWETWWAYALYLFLFLISLRAFVTYRSRALIQKNKILEQKVARRTAELKQSLEDLKSTQTQLIQSEKMASLGEMTAGIAHEIQNPLNFINNFSEVNNELIAEMNEEIEKGNLQEVKKIAGNVEENQQKIILHGKRADNIVKNMLRHSRASTGHKELTDINALADEYLRLSYHGLRAKDKTFNVRTKTDFDNSITKINVVSQDIGRVFLNLFNNAFYAVAEKKKKLGDSYEPVVSVSSKKIDGKIEIMVRDNGEGIPKKVLDKIFQPFFTTKPAGVGTGLGLSLSYDVIKAHQGELSVETKEGEYSEFRISLPIKSNV